MDAVPLGGWEQLATIHQGRDRIDVKFNWLRADIGRCFGHRLRLCFSFANGFIALAKTKKVAQWQGTYLERTPLARQNMRVHVHG